MEALKIEYDEYGRMKYNPEFHAKHGTFWSDEDLEYLINWFEFIGPEEMSFALERPSTAINQKVLVLRKQGKMSQAKYIKHERINKGTRRKAEKKKSCANSSTQKHKK